MSATEEYCAEDLPFIVSDLQAAQERIRMLEAALKPLIQRYEDVEWTYEDAFHDLLYTAENLWESAKSTLEVSA